MPTQRPFLSNFFAAFRAYNSPKSQPTLTTSGAVAASSQTIWTTASTASQKPTSTHQSSTSTSSSDPKPIINPKTTTYAAAASTSQDRLHAPLQHNVSPSTHLPSPVYGPQNKPQPSYPTAAESRRSSARRRGSDSSSDGGFRESRGGGPGGEKWFVGGRAPNGEERYYTLSMVRRERSSDRISADQLSL